MKKTEMLNELFGTERPIIALLHVDPLPGDPYFIPGTSMDEIIDHVKQDLANLQNGGVDGILFSNEFSMPYQNKVSQVTTSSLAYIIGYVRDNIKVPFGVHVISDGEATIELAAATGASFVRGIFTGAYVGEGGIKETDIAKVLRRKNELHMNKLKMFYMINAESDVYLNDRDLNTIVDALIFKCHPDGICLSGNHAGKDADNSFLDEMRKAAGNTAIFANTGCSQDNIAEKLKHCDGAFVGTGFKKDGKFENHTDGERVRKFMNIVRNSREKV